MADTLRKRKVAGIDGLANPSDSETVHSKAASQDQDSNGKMGHNRPGLAPPHGSWLLCLVLTGFALWTRLYKINWNDHVVWDEAHFGKFAGHYIKRTFYTDVHPPLGKMLNGFAGLLCGFNGKFEFESGAQYPAEVKYGVMRFFNAIYGAMVTPLAYWTGIHLRFSQTGAALLAVMTITDIAYCVISRFILLDSMLLFCTALATYTLCVFRTYQRFDPFSMEWFFWLAASGVSIGLVVSVKWVGLFAIALVGLHTVEDLWEALGDLSLSVKKQAIHLGSRVVFLIITPITVYMLVFVAHFAILNHSGPGDAGMSSLFQAGLKGNDFSSNPLELAYGSKISIKNTARSGGLLHSHIQKFPGGSEQQQITTYSHKDSNNEWVVEKAWGSTVRREDDPVEFVLDGDVIRLVHDSTKKNLHSHLVAAPLTDSENEVSGYGDGYSADASLHDPNDNWIIQRIDDFVVGEGKRFRSLSTKFRFIHQVTGCLLKTSGKNLPEWGFKQGEVVCEKKPDLEHPRSMWNIELHVNPRLPPGGKGVYRQSFLRNFIDVNVGMWTSNNALTPDPDKEPGQLESKPWHWPFMIRGLRMCGWGDYEIKYYLIGNPLIWWGSTAAMVLLVLTLVVYTIREKRGIKDFKKDEWDNFWFASKVGLLGWFLHYIPFYIMGRVMYVHHYFPALYFAMISFVALVDHFASRSKSKLISIGVHVVFALLFTAAFLYFADFAFGMAGPSKEYANRRWLQSWNIHD